MKQESHPHAVKVYGHFYHDIDGEAVELWGLLETVEFPSKSAALKYASERKRALNVTSATVVPL